MIRRSRFDTTARVVVVIIVIIHIHVPALQLLPFRAAETCSCMFRFTDCYDMYTGRRRLKRETSNEW